MNNTMHTPLCAVFKNDESDFVLQLLRPYNGHKWHSGVIMFISWNGTQ